MFLGLVIRSWQGSCYLLYLSKLASFSPFAHQPAAPVFLLEKTARAGKEQSEAKAKEQQRWRCRGATTT